MSRTAGVLLLAPLLLAAAAFAAPAQVASEIGQAMQDRDYARALQAIEAALQDPQSPHDYLTYLQGRAYHYLEQYDRAIRTFDSFEKTFPDSPWARQARFAKAICLTRTGDFLQAERTYRTEAEYLLSADRKQQIADIYLEFAKADFQPSERDRQPDYKRALEFFQKALEAAPPGARRVEVELLAAQCFQHLNDYQEAINRFSKFIEQHADSVLDVEARFRLGESQFQAGQLGEARRTWQDLLAKHEDGDSPRLAEARYRLASTHQSPHPPTAEDLSLAVAALQAFLARHPGHELAAQAYLEIARCYQSKNRFEDAAATINKYLAEPRYADSEETPEARFLLGQCYQLQRQFDKALATWKDYLSKHPAHQRWSEAQREIVATEYLMAAEQREAEKYPEARRLWSDFLSNHPLDERAPQILYLLGDMNFAQQKWEEAIADWRRLVSKYPHTDAASQAQFMIANTLEDKLGQFEQALDEYKKTSWGPFQNRARGHIARLTAKQMTVRTERVFRSSDKPKIRLTTRNIEKVTVRAYEIDLETYFRKMHLATGVESLDIALIDPTQTFEHQVPGYLKYKQIDSEIELPEIESPLSSTKPARRSGVLVATVSSETLEATTMLLQSDLDIIVKTSRDEVFVFAENMRTGKPWAGVKLLVSDGAKVFAEGETNADGVFQQSFDELRSAEDVRVFAAADHHTASNVVGLNGLSVARGLSNRGYIYTDRPAYRPGQIVNIRGVVRRVADDAYQVNAGKQFQLKVFDTRSRLVFQDQVELGEFGGFHCNLMLPPASPQGSYRILLTDEQEKQEYQGTFTVHQYKLESIQLAIESPRQVFYRGEEIEGKLLVKYYYGAPLPGREVRYRLADGPVHTAKTDDQGQVAFRLPTRDFRETQVLTLVAELPEYNLISASRFVLAAQEYSLAVSTPRPCYLTGESFEAIVKAADAEGKPTERTLTLSVLEKTRVNGRTGERLVRQLEAHTDKQSGEARVTLNLERGANYILRAEGVDRFSNPISGQHDLQISGDDDQVRLRILASQHTFKAGDQADIQVHWREEPALALITFQGARVLDYRLQRLRTGANPLTVPMTAELAPNFELAIAVMTDSPKAPAKEGQPPLRFHAASSPFTVQRDMLVRIEPLDVQQGQTVRPGSNMKVRITATDPQGAPVDAEVSLAMVEQSLLDRFPFPVPSIASFFRGEQRQAAVRTESSITFRYQPSTMKINQRLLNEEERLAIAAAEEARLEEMEEAEPAGVVADFDALLGLTVTDSFGLSDRRAVADDDGVSRPEGGEDSARGDQLRRRLAASQLFETDADRMAIVRGASGARGLSPQSERAGGVTIHIPGQMEGSSKTVVRNRLTLNAGDVLVLNGRQTDAAQLRAQLDVSSWDSEGHGLTAVLNNGVVAYYDVADLQGQRGEALLQQLQQADALLISGLPAQETGYWNPAIRTGADGQAEVEFTLPDRSTAWKLLAKGVTLSTLAGEAEGQLQTKKELFGELKLPLAFVDGDTAEILATAHHPSLTAGQITATLRTTIGGKTAQQTQIIEAEGGAEHALRFSVELRRPEQTAQAADVKVTFELILSAAGQQDRLQRVVPLEPYGYPVFGTASGAASSDATAWVELPTGLPASAASLQILVGPSVERGLLDVLFGPTLRCQIVNHRFTAGSDASASDLMAAVALQELVAKTLSADTPQADAIDQRIRAAMGVLVSSQRDDGGWTWTGREGQSDRLVSARSTWALRLAAQAGYPVSDETLAKAKAFLEDQAAKTDNADYETKAILLHALTMAGAGDFPLANRLYRSRPALSLSALLHLALALAEMDRQPMAEDVLRVAAERNFDESAPRRRSAQSSLPWSHSPTELRALYALALQATQPRDPKLDELAQWLLAHRVGTRWSPDKATGPATLVLCRWQAGERSKMEQYALAVRVNDQLVREIEFTEDAHTETLVVPAEVLRPGKQRVQFQLRGRGRFSYQCVLEGFVAASQLKSVNQDWRIERIYEAAPMELDGKTVPRGFDVLRGSYNSFRNPLTQLPVGRRGHVTLHAWRQGVPSGTPAEQLEYLVITEPVPSGATVIEDSVQGNFEWFEIAPGAITFYIGNRHYNSTISYDMHGFLPGDYRAAPPMIRDAYRPDQFAVHVANTLKVLPLGSVSGDAYRLTPRELYEVGKWHFDRGEMKQASERLNDLVENWSLKDEIYQDATRMLLDAHLQIGPPRQVVRHFEVIKERWPAMEIPYEKILRIGAAYEDMGEYERAYLIFRATVESSFLTESQAAGFLQSQQKLLRSVEVMGGLIREYPPEPYAAAALFDLAQQVYGMAPLAKTDKQLRDAQITRVDLIRRALRMLDGFLTAYPEDPGADQAAFSQAAALLELEQYQAAIDACDNFVRRYPNSRDIDGFWYTVGFCNFALGQHQQALEICRKVAQMQRKDPQTGRIVEAENRDRAIYILGQIYHSLGQAAQAIQEYSRIEDKFPDANEAIEYFARRHVRLPEVTSSKPGEPVQVELCFRNIARCETKVYRIDLMKYSLLKRDLRGITNINLAGIRPLFEDSIELGDGKDYRDRTHELQLPLDKEGAYLVVCRGDELHATGLVLITPLEVEAQEEASSGRVRATVRDSVAGGYASHVHVKAIGSANEDFVSGETDLRGVFVADGIRGVSTIIAQADSGRYAFYRGTQQLGPAQPAIDQQVKEKLGQEAAAPEQPASNELLQGLYLRNSVIQGENLRRQQQQYFNDKSGVTVEAVK